VSVDGADCNTTISAMYPVSPSPPPPWAPTEVVPAPEKELPLVAVPTGVPLNKNDKDVPLLEYARLNIVAASLGAFELEAPSRDDACAKTEAVVEDRRNWRPPVAELASSDCCPVFALLAFATIKLLSMAEVADSALARRVLDPALKVITFLLSKPLAV
jgi:hypothetical protein